MDIRNLPSGPGVREANPHLFPSGATVPIMPNPRAAAESESAFTARSERELQVQIETMLRRYGVHVIRSRMDKRTTTAKGTPDILFAVAGRAVAWEAKMPGKKPTQEQVDTLAAMSANGWITAVIDSYDQALSAYREIAGNLT